MSMGVQWSNYLQIQRGVGCLSATLSTVDSMYTTLKLNVWLHSDKPVTNYTACHLLICTVV